MDIENLKIIEKRFISEILRTFTHDLKNDIAIIKETSGFIEDIITFKLDEIKNYLGKKHEALDVINETVLKADKKIKALNKFAHKLCENPWEFYVGETVTDYLDLSSSHLKRHKIIVNFTYSEDFYIFNNSLLITYILHKIICYLIKCYCKNFSIDISLFKETNYISLEFKSHSFIDDPPVNIYNQLDIEDEIVQLCKVRINLSENGKIVVSFPFNENFNFQNETK